MSATTSALERILDEYGATERGPTLFMDAQRLVAAARSELAEMRQAGVALDDCTYMAARMYIELQQCRCECSVSVQPPHSVKCARCRAVYEFERHRSFEEASARLSELAALVAERDALRAALEEIAEFHGKALLGDGRFDEGANAAFEQAAEIATAALSARAASGEQAT